MAYERNNFKTGQVLTADALNHMEEGIAKAMEGGGITATTYAELKALRDANGLKAGAFYRITDYMTTTTQENTQSAGHQFDVIVLALDGGRLSEKAWAAHHEGDEYFKDSNLSAWQIWYCLDNDTDRFVWSLYPYVIAVFSLTKGPYQTNGSAEINAHNKVIEYNGIRHFVLFNNYGFDFCVSAEDVAKGSGVVYAHSETLHDAYGTFEVTEKQESEGKGVIYRMIDEFNNDVPYDFKNIIYDIPMTADGEIKKYSSWYKASVMRQTESDTIVAGVPYYAWKGRIIAGPSGEAVAYSRTEDLSDMVLYDISGESVSESEYMRISSVKPAVRQYTFNGRDDADGSMRDSAHNNVIKTYGIGSNNSRAKHNFIMMGQYANRIIFDISCHDITFGSGGSYITFGSGCSNNTFGDSCNYNTFGGGCGYQTLPENTNGKNAGFNSNGEVVIKNLFD